MEMSKPRTREERVAIVLGMLRHEKDVRKTPNHGVIEKFQDFATANREIVGKTLGDVFDDELNLAARKIAFKE